MSRLTQIAIVAAFLAVLVASGAVMSGCGGSDDAPALSKAEFIKQGDAVCRRFENEKKVLIETFVSKEGRGPLKSLSNTAQLEMVTDAIVPPIKSIGEELRALGIPDSDQGKGEAIVSGLEEVVEELEDNPKRMSRQPDPFETVAKEAGDYGFKTCILYY